MNTSQLYKVTYNNNTMYIRANSWFEIFKAIFAIEKDKKKLITGACIMPMKSQAPTLCAKQAGFPNF